ncbi:UDP-N-acetylmuramoyl-tripeptide--D-alanyl-D-alanine ligase [Dictyoglomus thermophilum]|uniref:UDP-N-acetylmuramoyl-tripeptide--D-alanyl-D-alanine ligase n=1 Tax=Dictyoglomus thermophilum (strain ATCC 35947 / DSM 3960 / H-6-12) TaxID=309799 RepID=B5YEL7_DICT6|nr:UDP-N-acetylmuramoyl-tripeptide--D-alanyl-D-alanine ligase [Dictyoglomus thermophilum]ACI19321.1 UDP-N-acetylmuramoyl-tripeptide--D-alanyl-D-alanine ligase [Dictyoglomus thermophilum H-6-12]
MSLNLTVEDILKATKGILIKGNFKDKVDSISTDSRNIKKDDVFIALKGEKFDGHEFVKDAILKGAKGVIVSRDVNLEDKAFIIKVQDTLKALQDIANYYLKTLNAKVIGITGSSGKTTTKNLVGRLLKLIGKVYVSKENFNNEIGVPLSILEAEKDVDFLVLEMAMRGKGEISLLSKIAEPDIGVITNIGWAHIGRLGSREAIMEAKAEIFDYIKEDGIAILNRDDSFSMKIYERLHIKKYTFGFEEGSDLRGLILDKGKESYTLGLYFPDGKRLTLSLPVYPLNIYRNLLSALLVLWSISPESIYRVKEDFDFTLPKQRLDVKRNKDGLVIIDDTYNANPDSMKTAIEYLELLDVPGRKVALLGDMLELGNYSIEGHKEVIEEVLKRNIDVIVLYGQEMKKALDEFEKIDWSKVHWSDNPEEIKSILRRSLQPKDTVLIKGSRAMRMEDFVKFLEDEYDCSVKY